MVSTPSRSSAATTISLPCIVGPTSARSWAAAGFGSIVVLLILLGALRPVIAGKEKNPRPLPAVGSCRNRIKRDKARRHGHLRRRPQLQLAAQINSSA